MLKQEMYRDILKESKEPLSIVEWATKIIEKSPSILKQIDSRTNRPVRFEAFVSALSLKVSKGEMKNVQVVENKPYRQVMYLSDLKKNELMKQTLADDLASISINKKIQRDIDKASEYERYRLEEFKNVTEQLNKYFAVNFVLHHAYSLKKERKEAKHHADNLQILTFEHSLVKKDADKRFSIEEQKAYIKRSIVVHMMIDRKIELNLIDEVLEMLLDRLDKVY